MSQPCAIVNCKRGSRALCHCCQQHVCMPHLNEHNDLLNSQLHPLVDDINTLGERLETFNIQNIVNDSRQKLEQWRQDCHQKIDHFFEQKCGELDRLVAEKFDKQRENIISIRSNVAKLILDQEATRQDIETLTSTIGDIETEMKKIEEARFQVNTCPLLIDDTMVQIKDVNEHEFHLSALSSVYKTIACPQGSWPALASNGRLLLTHLAPNLCLLNTELTIVKQVLWPSDSLSDMCWSSTLDRFIVITKENIFLVDANTMSIERVQMVETLNWLSGTCFNDRLFLSTYEWGSSIVEISLSPSIAIINHWKSPRTCSKNESIDDLVYSDGTLAILITNKVEKSVRMELRCCKTLDRRWSLLLDVVCNNDVACRCCSLDFSGWIVDDFGAKRLLHITTDGKIKEIITYKAIPYRLTLFGPNMLAISTQMGINLHKI